MAMYTHEGILRILFSKNYTVKIKLHSRFQVMRDPNEIYKIQSVSGSTRKNSILTCIKREVNNFLLFRLQNHKLHLYFLSVGSRCNNDGTFPPTS